MKRFQEVAHEARPKDLGFYGGEFMWYNGRDGDAGVWERLDRCFVNETWQSLLLNECVLHGTVAYSDHVPIWLKVLGRGGNSRKRPRRKCLKPFRFETYWMHDEEFR